MNSLIHKIPSLSDKTKEALNGLDQYLCSSGGSLERSVLQIKLGTHLATAVFKGKKQQHCPFSNCPENCSHSGILATFEITHYLYHRAAGDKQDARLHELSFLANHFPFAEEMAELKEGDTVKLGWQRIGRLDFWLEGTYEEETSVAILKKTEGQPRDLSLEGEEEEQLLDDWGISIMQRGGRGGEAPTSLMMTEEYCF